MKKFAVTILSGLTCVCAAFALGACGGEPADGTQTPKDPVILPTAAEIVSARRSVDSDSVKGYDFDLTFTGDFSVLGLGASLSGKYDGSYRYDGDTDEVTFKRTTSGALLADSTCYVFTSGDSRIKATTVGNTVKKLAVETPEEQDVTMVNLPIVAIVDAIKESNISNIAEKKNSEYAYSCRLSTGNDNILYTGLGKVFEKLGTGVSFKGIELSGNASTLDFNIKDGKLNDFRLAFNMQIDVKAVKVGLTVDYSQKGSTTAIALPNLTNSGFIYTDSAMATEIDSINAAISDLKDDPVYSLDLTAKNEFDPGWNKLAVVDSYGARMYKTTIDDAVWFNHSYYYKSHSETDGKETYKYTLGNVNGADADNQGAWLISRKSTNRQTRADGITADTQFDFLTDAVRQNAAEIDCIKKEVVGTTTTYSLFVGKTATQRLQEKIIGMINTNPYDEVIAVDNYFNTDNIIKDASVKFVLTDGKISSVVCETELCYTPIGGDYTEYNITLNNNIELNVNKNLSKAQSYSPPTKVKGTVLGFGKNLNDSEYYIL